MIFLVIFFLTHRGPRVKLGIYKVVLTFKIAFVGRTVHNSDQGGGIHPPPALIGKNVYFIVSGCRTGFGLLCDPRKELRVNLKSNLV